MIVFRERENLKTLIHINFLKRLERNSFFLAGNQISEMISPQRKFHDIHIKTQLGPDPRDYGLFILRSRTRPLVHSRWCLLWNPDDPRRAAHWNLGQHLDVARQSSTRRGGNCHRRSVGNPESRRRTIRGTAPRSCPPSTVATICPAASTQHF